jgi:hypothetical protein
MTAAVNPSIYAYPYIMLLVTCLIVAIVVFWKVPSLRIHRRKRNLLLYVVLLVFMIAFAYQTYDQSMGLPVVSYTLKSEKQFLAGQTTTFDVTCRNLGRATSFYLTLNAANATLTASGPDYIQVNDTFVKITF